MCILIRACFASGCSAHAKLSAHAKYIIHHVHVLLIEGLLTVEGKHKGPYLYHSTL